MASATVPLPPRISLPAWEQAAADPSVMIIDGNSKVTVRAGQLHVVDGPPGQTRTRTVAKVPRTVERVLFLTGHGYRTSESERWLAWADIPWAALDTETGKFLCTSDGAASDARLLRAQSIAGMTPAALEIARLLLSAKLRGQAKVLDNYLPASDAADFIRKRADDIDHGTNLTSFGSLEGKAADAYWSTWAGRVAVPFSPSDMLKVPSYWLSFAQRKSLNGRQPPNADASCPTNAILNYLYAVGLTESIHACHAYGIHPALGISHADKPGRDSMALDLMEVIRPACDSIALGMLAPDGTIPYVDGKPAYIDRRMLTETREGTCRILPPLTHKLASHAAELGALVMPYAREVAAILARHADGVVTVPRVAGVQKLGQTERRHNYPAARLRAGVGINDVIPDSVWAQVESLLPVPDKPKRGRRYSASPREIAACLVIRYVLRCPWKDVPMGSMGTVENWLKLWTRNGTWDKAREIIESHGHLGVLIE